MENPHLSQVTVAQTDLETLLRLFEAMFTSTEVDRLEQQYTRSGEAFFHVAGRGHESGAALNPHLIPQDWLSCHYRSKALMLARGLSLQNLFGGFFAKDDCHSRGRQMSAHLSSPKHHITSLVGPVGNNALSAVGIAAEIVGQRGDPISVCCLGEGSTQQGEVLEALLEAQRQRLPVLFLVEDNGWAISTPTAGTTFYSLDAQPADAFCGISIHYLDGLDAIDCYYRFGEVVGRMRQTREPAIVVMRCKRLSDHTNADDQTLYRQAADISADLQRGCPVHRLGEALARQGLKSAIEQRRERAVARVREAAETALLGANPQPCRQATAALPPRLDDPREEYLGRPDGDRLTMIEGLRAVLHNRLDSDPRVSLYGQDIEDPKGDVFGLTRGLSTRFAGRVRNAPLSESTIVGTAIGRALAGGRPVAMLQFSDFLPLAFNQICSELSTMYWRTDGGWQCPVIIMAPCGGYRPGLGHFHAQSFESIAAHLPGIDVLVPSTAADAAAGLNAAFESPRPTLFFYPKALLNDREQTTSSDIARHLATVGRARIVRPGSDLTIVAWGNTIARALAAADMLSDQGKCCEVIDLRYIAPWDRQTVIRSVDKTGRLLVVHEDGHTCGMGAEIIATVTEALPPGIECRRLTRPDTHIPCNFANQLDVLPSIKAAVEIAADMLGMAVSWEAGANRCDELVVIEAIGASPSDELVTINAWHVGAGDRVEEGDLLVEYEADKAVTELLSPYRGVVDSVLVEAGASARVGAPLLTLRLDDPAANRAKPLTREPLTRPSFQQRPRRQQRPGAGARTALQVGIKHISQSCGATQVGNAELAGNFPERSPEDIIKSTGIASRPRAGEGQTAVSLAVQACRQLLQSEGLHLGDIDTLICATGTPGLITPSTACQVMAAIDPQAQCAAYDINAACSGYLYALGSAYDVLQSRPDARVLVVTTELLSPLLDPDDYTTAILFGDAATATLVCGEARLDGCGYRLQRPLLSGQADADGILRVPHRAAGTPIQMDGMRVFSMGVRKMTHILQRALDEAGLPLEDVALIVPHQANQRIMDAIAKKLNLPPERFFSNIQRFGNTSSNSIPLALTELFASALRPDNIALTAFGGGFTYGACILTPAP